MGKRKNMFPVTKYAEIRDKYNEVHPFMSQTALGEKIGVDKMTVSRYENGERIPTLDVVMKYCEIFEVDKSYFIEDATLDKNVINAVLHKMGLNDSAVHTLYMLKKNSSAEENLSTTANALIGNGIFTEMFIKNLFHYAIAEKQDAEIAKQIFLREMQEYIDVYVCPALQKLIKGHDSVKNNIPAITETDYNESEQMMKANYESEEKEQ